MYFSTVEKVFLLLAVVCVVSSRVQKYVCGTLHHRKLRSAHNAITIKLVTSGDAADTSREETEIQGRNKVSDCTLCKDYLNICDYLQCS